MRRGTSHELLHPSMPGFRDFTTAHTPKDEKIKKSKDEEKKKKGVSKT